MVPLDVSEFDFAEGADSVTDVLGSGLGWEAGSRRIVMDPWGGWDPALRECRDCATNEAGIVGASISGVGSSEAVRKSWNRYVFGWP